MLSLFHQSDPDPEYDPYFLRDKVIYIDLDGEAPSATSRGSSNACISPLGWMRVLAVTLNSLSDQIDNLRLHITGSRW